MTLQASALFRGAAALGLAAAITGCGGGAAARVVEAEQLPLYPLQVRHPLRLLLQLQHHHLVPVQVVLQIQFLNFRIRFI